ncbi:hypothetical protein N0V88_003519 [Collariella sp. IMI 366227]|nr:hypothetical protein N0V88_003519 [Collariella sp. IMI 366227]
MPAPAYHQVIDPAITGPPDASMPPPPVPSAKNLQAHAQAVQHVARRGTRRDGRASSVGSINSIAPTTAFSSQPEPRNIEGPGTHRVTPARAFGTPRRAASVMSREETPSQRAARTRLMNFMLDRLFTASDDLFVHLCSDRMDPEMWDAERLGFRDAFEVYRSHYVPDPSSPVVDLAFVAAMMRLNETSPAWHKASRVVSAANLATLLDDLTALHQEDLLPLLQEWDSCFPDSFITEDIRDTGRNVSSETRNLVENLIIQTLDIRTHLSVSTYLKLHADQSNPSKPIEEVAKLWCSGNPSIEAVQDFLNGNKDAVHLKVGAWPDPGAADLDSQWTGTRFNAVFSLLLSEADPQRIYETFSLDNFVGGLRELVKTCFGKIKDAVRQEYSAGRDHSLPLGASDPGSRADSQIRSQLDTDAVAQAYNRTGSGPPVSYNLDALRMMKQVEQHEAVPYGDALPSTYPPAPRIPYPAGSLYADPTQQGGFPADGSLFAASAAEVSGRKRPGPAGMSAAPVAKKARTRRKKNEVPEASMGPTPGTAQEATAVAGPATQSQYPPLPGSQDEHDLDAMYQRTKEVSAAARKAKEPQVRSSWVRKDVLLLIKAVEAYQCKWSTIEKEIKAGTIPFERPRDQQALRDKARLSDSVLPRGFDLVVLGKKEREAVRACGKNPERKEGDVNESGKPVNTELEPEDAAAPALLPAPLAAAEPQPEPQQEALPEAQPEMQNEVQLEMHHDAHLEAQAAQHEAQPEAQVEIQQVAPEPTAA